MQRRLFVPLFLGLLLLPLAAQEDTEEKPRRLLLYFMEADQASFSAVETRLLYESLSSQLATAEAPFHVIEWGNDPPETDADRSVTALDQNCDAWIAVEVRGSMDQASYRIWSYDLVTRKQTIDTIVEREAPLRPRDLERRFWNEAVEAVAANYRGVEVGTRVTFEGAPGTTISGLPIGPLTIDSDGSAQVALPNPSLFTIRATEREHHPVSMTFTLGDDPLTISLNQELAPRWVVDAYLSTLNFPGGAVAYFVEPNYTYVKLGLTTYLLGVYVSGNDDPVYEDESKLFQSLPLTTLHLQAGRYFTRPENRIRPYAAAGGVLRIMHSKDFFGLEPLAPVAVELVLGAEMPVWWNITGYFEMVPTWYFSPDVDLLAASYPVYHSAFNVVHAGSGLIDLLKFHLGARFPL